MPALLLREQDAERPEADPATAKRFGPGRARGLLRRRTYSAASSNSCRVALTWAMNRSASAPSTIRWSNVREK